MKTRIAAIALVASAACLVNIANNEGYQSRAYKDSGGIWTIGYGETKGVTKNTKTTPERALLQLKDSLDAHEKGIKACLKDIPLFQHEYDAYLDLAYNVGAGSVCRSSIIPKLQKGQYEAACNTILTFDKIQVRGKKVSCKDPKNNCLGIVKRRQKTYHMCMGTKHHAL